MIILKVSIHKNNINSDNIDGIKSPHKLEFPYTSQIFVVWKLLLTEEIITNY